MSLKPPRGNIFDICACAWSVVVVCSHMNLSNRKGSFPADRMGDLKVGTSDRNALRAAGDGHICDLELAENLMHTCYEMYRQTPTGLAPEIVFFLGPEKDAPKGHQVCCFCFGTLLS